MLHHLRHFSISCHLLYCLLAKNPIFPHVWSGHLGEEWLMSQRVCRLWWQHLCAIVHKTCRELSLTDTPLTRISKCFLSLKAHTRPWRNECSHPHRLCRVNSCLLCFWQCRPSPRMTPWFICWNMSYRAEEMWCFLWSAATANVIL